MEDGSPKRDYLAFNCEANDLDLDDMTGPSNTAGPSNTVGPRNTVGPTGGVVGTIWGDKEVIIIEESQASAVGPGNSMRPIPWLFQEQHRGR